MKLALQLVGAFLAAAFFKTTDATVVELNAENFYPKVTQGTWMVKFYAPWCGHCKALAGPYHDFSEMDLDGAKVGKLDCTVSRAICSRLGIRGYPTLKVISDSQQYEYSGSRDPKAMAAFVTEGYKEAPSVPLLSESDHEKKERDMQEKLRKLEARSKVVTLSKDQFLKDVMNSTDPWFVKFYAPWCGHCKQLSPTWTQLSIELDESGSKSKIGKVDCTEERSLCGRLDVTGYPTLYHFQGGQYRRFKGSRTFEALNNFVQHGWKEAEAEQVPVEDKLSDRLQDYFAENPLYAVLLGIFFVLSFFFGILKLLDTVFPDEGFIPWAAPKESSTQTVEGEEKDTTSTPAPEKSAEAKKNE